MAAAPQYKIYDRHGQYQAACKEPEAAAALVSLYSEGATIRLGHRTILWQEGKEAQCAGESYDFVAETIIARERQL